MLHYRKHCKRKNSPNNQLPQQKIPKLEEIIPLSEHADILKSNHYKNLLTEKELQSSVSYFKDLNPSEHLWEEYFRFLENCTATVALFHTRIHGQFGGHYLTELPEEMFILICSFVDVQDVLNLSKTCTSLKTKLDSPVIWKQIYFNNWDYCHRNPDKFANDWKKLTIERLRVLNNIKNKRFKITTQRYVNILGTNHASFHVKGGKLLIRFYSANLLWNEKDLRPLESNIEFHRSDGFAFFEHFTVGQNGKKKIQIQKIDQLFRKNVKGIGFCMKSENEVFVLETEKKIVLYQIECTHLGFKLLKKLIIMLENAATKIKMDEYTNAKLYSEIYFPKETKPLLMVFHSDYSFSLYDAEKGNKMKTIDTGSKYITDFKFNANLLIVSNYEDGKRYLFIWKINDEIRTQNLEYTLMDLVGDVIILQNNLTGKITLLTPSFDQKEFKDVSFPCAFRIETTKKNDNSLILFTERSQLTCMNATTEECLSTFPIPEIMSIVYMDWHQVIYISRKHMIVKIDFNY